MLSQSRYLTTLFLGSAVPILCLFFLTVSFLPSWCLCLAGTQLHTNSNVRSENEDQADASILDSPWVTSVGSVLFLTWQWQTKVNQSLHFAHYEIRDCFLDFIMSSVMFDNCFKVPPLSVLDWGFNQVFLLVLKNVRKYKYCSSASKHLERICHQIPVINYVKVERKFKTFFIQN